MSNTTDTASRRPVFEWAVDETSMRQQIAALEWSYYVYALCDDTGAAFYIGKGRGDRLFQHAIDAAEGESSAKCDAIRGLGERLRFALLLVCEDEPYALGFEAMTIRQHFNALTNKVNGAESAIARMAEQPKQINMGLLLYEAIFKLWKMDIQLRQELEAIYRKHPGLREYQAARCV